MREGHGVAFVSSPPHGATTNSPLSRRPRQTGLCGQSIPEDGQRKDCCAGGSCSGSSLLGAGVSHPSEVEAWLGCSQKKICLKAPDTSVFDELSEGARKQNIPQHIVQDAGHADTPRGSSTVLALGPYDEAVLDELTVWNLKLL